MENKELGMADEIYRILSLDFKDELGYKVEIKDFKKMSAVQKWFIYDKYAKRDADGIFPVGNIIKALLKTIGQEIDDAVLEVKSDIYEIIDGRALTQKLHDAGDHRVRAWHNYFKEQLERLCKNVHTVGNYPLNPDRDYSDRIDLLYSEILEPLRKADGEPLMPREHRENWNVWIDENKEKLFLGELLDEKKRDELEKLARIKQDSLSDDELKELPNYLETVNALIEHRTKKIKNICYEAVQNAYFECYKNTLSEFEHGKVFMQICSFGKGYVWVAPEYEKQFESGELVKLFNLEIGKYFAQKPIDKVVGEASWANLFEYAYLALYDCYIDYGLSVQNNWSLDDLKERAAYFAFKEYDLVKDYYLRYYDEDAFDE